MRRFFDPDAYRIVLFDQRGSGRSTPAGSLKDNSPAHLVADIERLREELGIDTWASCLAPLTFASHAYDDFHLLMPLFAAPAIYPQLILVPGAFVLIYIVGQFLQVLGEMLGHPTAVYPQQQVDSLVDPSRANRELVAEPVSRQMLAKSDMGIVASTVAILPGVDALNRWA